MLILMIQIILVLFKLFIFNVNNIINIIIVIMYNKYFYNYMPIVEGLTNKRDSSKDTNEDFSKWGLSIGDINKSISILNESIACDSTCQRNKEIQELKNKLKQAKLNKANADSNVNSAEKNYYSFVEGPYAYKELLFNRNSKIVNKAADRLHNDSNNLIKELHTLIDYYESQMLYSENVTDLFDTKYEKITKLENKIDNNINSINTTDRKIYYELNELDNIGYYKKLFMILTYILFVIYLIFGNFFQKKLYKNNYINLTLLLYLIFPLIVYRISKFIYYILKRLNYLFYNKSPRNIYTDI